MRDTNADARTELQVWPSANDPRQGGGGSLAMDRCCMHTDPFGAAKVNSATSTTGYSYRIVTVSRNGSSHPRSRELFNGFVYSSLRLSTRLPWSFTAIGIGAVEQAYLRLPLGPKPWCCRYTPY
jgi:hypothetical protein